MGGVEIVDGREERKAVGETPPIYTVFFFLSPPALARSVTSSTLGLLQGYNSLLEKEEGKKRAMRHG